MTLPRPVRSVLQALRHRGPFRLATQTAGVLWREGPRGIARRLQTHHAPAMLPTDPGADPRSCIIVTTPHVAHVARMMDAILTGHGYSVQIATDTAGAERFALAFVLCPQMFATLPPNPIVFQMEQSVSSRWFTPDYLERLRRARAVLDYSTSNIAWLRQQGVPLERLYHVPLDTDPTIPESAAPRSGVLFYGDASSSRRRALLQRLQVALPELEIAQNLFGAELAERLDRTAVVLNLHFYDGALLETARLNQVLSHGALVVSEAGSDAEQHADLASIVDFAPVGDVEALIRLVRGILDQPAAERAVRHARVRAHATRPGNRFRTGFRRFLLAQGIITSEEWRAAESPPALSPPARLCLTLPETPERGRAFLAQPQAAGFRMWTGLRAAPGWRGAALAHADLCRCLLAQGIDEAVICEDDVIFPDGFDARFAAVRSCLDAKPDWELFSGLIADADPGWRVTGAEEHGGVLLARLDHSVSMVFNILRRPVIEHLAAWDDRNDDPFTNTIDRWLARRPTRVVTALPFLVGHRPGSTLRDASVTHYDRLIAASQTRLMAQARIHLNRSGG